MENNLPKKRSRLMLLMRYIIGISFVLSGVLNFLEAPLASLCMIAMAAILLPPVMEHVYLKTGRKLSKPIKILSLFILFILTSMFFSQSEQRESDKIAKQKAIELETQRQSIIDYFNNNSQEILSEIESSINTGETQKAVTLSSKYLVTNNEDIIKLNLLANEKHKTEKTNRILADLKKIPISEFARNKQLYQQLVDMHPDNQRYREKVAEYTNKIEEENNKMKLAEKRASVIEEQFSQWDGSHRELTSFIKDNMNDPRSYKHDKTVYWDRGDHLIVQTTFRGKNAFGGVVKNSVKAKVSLNGQVLQILE